LHSPIAEFTGQTIAKRIGLSPILRAGIGMTDGEWYEYERCRRSVFGVVRERGVPRAPGGMSWRRFGHAVSWTAVCASRSKRKGLGSQIARQHLRGAGIAQELLQDVPPICDIAQSPVFPPRHHAAEVSPVSRSLTTHSLSRSGPVPRRNGAPPRAVP
jgi:hypothetical protein